MEKTKPTLDKGRRAFIKNVLKGTISGSLFLVIPAGAEVLNIPEQIHDLSPY